MSKKSDLGKLIFFLLSAIFWFDCFLPLTFGIDFFWLLFKFRKQALSNKSFYKSRRGESFQRGKLPSIGLAWCMNSNVPLRYASTPLQKGVLKVALASFQLVTNQDKTKGGITGRIASMQHKCSWKVWQQSTFTTTEAYWLHFCQKLDLRHTKLRNVTHKDLQFQASSTR